MIGVRKISHASYETPDLDKQTEYYTDVLGLTLIAKGAGRGLSRKHDRHHSVILRQGVAAEMHAHRVPARARRRSRRVREADRRAWRADRRARQDAEPTIGDMVAFEDPKGTVMEVFKRPEPQSQRISQHRHRPAQARPRRLPRDRRQGRHQLLLRRPGLPGVRLDGRLLLVPALRRRPSHHQPGRDRLEQAFPYRLRVARLGAHADAPAIFSARTATRSSGARAATASATISSPTIAARTG